MLEFTSDWVVYIVNGRRLLSNVVDPMFIEKRAWL